MRWAPVQPPRHQPARGWMPRSPITEVSGVRVRTSHVVPASARARADRRTPTSSGDRLSIPMAFAAETQSPASATRKIDAGTSRPRSLTPFAWPTRSRRSATPIPRTSPAIVIDPAAAAIAASAPTCCHPPGIPCSEATATTPAAAATCSAIPDRQLVTAASAEAATATTTIAVSAGSPEASRASNDAQAPIGTTVQTRTGAGIDVSATAAADSAAATAACQGAVQRCGQDRDRDGRSECPPAEEHVITSKLPRRDGSGQRERPEDHGGRAVGGRLH